MKKLIILFALLPFFSHAQTTQYKPLNLDTSCFWIQTYHDYHGSQPQINIYGEVLQYVEKDTIIMGQKYHKVRGYPTANMIGSTNSIGALWAYTYYNPTILLREDTLAKKIYRRNNYPPYNEEVLLNFDVMVGDTISYSPPTTPLTGAPVDSITTVNYFSINRRTIFANFGVIQPIIAYARIEGVGATLNFPDMRTVEWGIPVFTLQTFVRNSTVIYKDSLYPIDSCYRKSAYAFWPVAVNNVAKLSFSSFFMNNELIIQNPDNEDLNITILNLQGQPIFTLKSHQNFIQQRIENVAAGIYILNTHTKNGVQTEKIFVQ